MADNTVRLGFENRPLN